MASANVSKSVSLEDRKSRRLIFAYKTAALIVISLSLFWAMAFLSMKWWWLAGAELGLFCLALASWFLIHYGRLSMALIVSELGFLAFAVMMCLLFDVPSAAVPRVTHLYLLVLAALGYINFQRNGSKVQLVLIGLCLAAFVAFASTPMHFDFAQPMSDDIRLGGSWINVIIATAMLCGGAYIMQIEFARTNKLAHELQIALWNDEFTLNYQPQVNRAGTTLGAEVLLRWNNPERGPVSPVEFIPVAEQAGLMVRIGAWVLNEACKTLAIWQDSPDTSHLTLSVNVSASQFLEDSFEHSVLSAIEIHRINPTLLKLELTESVMVADMETVIAKMHILRAVGVSISLDDFGTGFSSLSYLRRLPINQLKLDRSFVQDVVENKRSATMARNIIQLGRDMDIAVIAEGVETQEQFSFLREHGCAEFQGFLFGRPVPLAEFERKVHAAAA